LYIYIILFLERWDYLSPLLGSEKLRLNIQNVSWWCVRRYGLIRQPNVSIV